MYQKSTKKKLEMNISIIIPLKVTNLNEETGDFIEFVNKLSQSLSNQESEIIVSDGSNSEIFKYIDLKLDKTKALKHIRISNEFRKGKNDKLNGIECALQNSKYDKILLIDDHFRISKEEIINISSYYNKYDCFKMMPKFESLDYGTLIDLCGMFVVNVVDYRKQYCGHLAFTKDGMRKAGFPDKDLLFDEYAMEEKFRMKKLQTGFLKKERLSASQNIPFKKFVEQRIRYAYENLAFPLRFACFLSILPLLILILNYSNIENLILIFIGMSAIVSLVCLYGQIIYGENISPWYTFLLTPLWFWPYAITTWFALFMLFTGGVNFGGEKIKKAG